MASRLIFRLFVGPRQLRSYIFLGRADQGGGSLTGCCVQREPVVTARRCRARCAQSEEQQDRRWRVSLWSGVAGKNQRHETAATGRVTQGMRRRPALITLVRRGQEDMQQGVEDARIDNVIIIIIIITV